MTTEYGQFRPITGFDFRINRAERAQRVHLWALLAYAPDEEASKGCVMQASACHVD